MGGHVEEGPRENEGSGRQQERVTERSERRERRLPASGPEAWSDALENALFFTFPSPKKFKAVRTQASKYRQRALLSTVFTWNSPLSAGGSMPRGLLERLLCPHVCLTMPELPSCSPGLCLCPCSLSCGVIPSCLLFRANYARPSLRGIWQHLGTIWVNICGICFGHLSSRDA